MNFEENTVYLFVLYLSLTWFCN